jgi:hypothetical protein
MTSAEPPADGPFTLAFLGYAAADQAARASAFEDEVLPLLADHGGRVLYRGRRTSSEAAAGPDEADLPLEIHLLWFPDRAALAGYMADDRRRALLDRYGEVFTAKHAFEIATLVGDLAPGQPG